jgi:hypothetical protein
MGCCVLGTSVKWETQRTCDLDAQSLGFGSVGNWQQVTEQECLNLAMPGKYGACLYGSSAPYDCQYQLYEQCTSGNFYEGVFCNDPNLNTNCEDTGKKMCFDDDVYQRTTCGPGRKLQNCDYASGTKCDKDEEGKYTCVSLDCRADLRNGESECVYDRDIFSPEMRSYVSGNAVKNLGMAKDPDLTCGNRVTPGDINTCDTYDGCSGSGGGCFGYICRKDCKEFLASSACDAYCKSNVYPSSVTTPSSQDSYTCISIVSSFSSTSSLGYWTCPANGVNYSWYANNVQGTSQSNFNSQGDLCNQNCNALRFINAGSSLNNPRSFGDAEKDFFPVGSTFAIGHCSDGKETFEPCDDARAQYCEPSRNARCINNNFRACHEAETQEECSSDDCIWFDPLNWSDRLDTSNGQYILEAGSPEIMFKILDYMSFAIQNPNKTNGVFDETLLKSLDYHRNLSTCVPKVPYGNYKKLSSSSDLDVCSKGNFNAHVRFFCTHGGGPVENYCVFFLDNSSNSSTPANYSEDLGLLYTQLSEWTNLVHDYDLNEPWKFPHRPYSLAAVPGPNWPDTHDFWNEVDNIPDNLDNNGVPLNPLILKILRARCSSLGDCNGDLNWAGVPGEVSSNGDWKTRKTSNILRTYEDYLNISYEGDVPGADWAIMGGNFTFTCRAWDAPETNNCTLCSTWNPIIHGAEKYPPCTPYRCEALGEKCVFQEVSDSDEGGFCVSSEDNVAPDIRLVSSSPSIGQDIPPYEPLELRIETSEISRCKFNLNHASSEFDLMNYDFGNEWATEHGLVLYMSGQLVSQDYNDSEFDFETQPLLKEGKNELYVRCIDPSENGARDSPFVITFNVKKMPDRVPPVLSNFTPPTNSRIKYNTTTKEMSFKTNELAECKWDFNDTSFSLMKHSFSCDTVPTNRGLVNGYGCSGTLTNITAGTFEQVRYNIVCDGPTENPCREVQTTGTIILDGTNFYIRCKDQPWLEGKEDSIYRRNENSQSTPYTLSPSLSALNITKIEPFGEVTKSAGNYSIDLNAFTSGGANEGISTCYWRTGVSSPLTSGYTKFLTTNSNSHKQALSYLAPGTNYIQVKCEDYAGNIDIKEVNVNLIIDTSAPFIKKIYNLGGRSGDLTLVMNEFASCYYSFDKNLNCLFNIANASLFSASGKTQKADWKDDGTYHIKCKDPFGNINSGCSAVVRVY